MELHSSDAVQTEQFEFFPIRQRLYPGEVLKRDEESLLRTVGLVTGAAMSLKR